MSTDEAGRMSEPREDVGGVEGMVPHAVIQRTEGEGGSSFDIIAERLGLDQATRARVWDLLDKVGGKGAGPGRCWVACALYVDSMRDISDTTGATARRLTLTQLLRVANCRLIEFFNHLKRFLQELSLTSDFEERLQLLERKFVLSAILFRKYQQLFRDIIEPCQPKEKMPLFCFGWTVFLFCKAKLFGDQPELVTSYHALLCVLHLLIRHLPGGSSDARSLEHLCGVTGTTLEEVQAVNAELQSLWQKLIDTNILSVPASGEIVLDASFLLASRVNLDREYETIFGQHKGDFDERLFLSPEDQDRLVTPSRFSPEVSRTTAAGGHSTRRNLSHEYPELNDMNRHAQERESSLASSPLRPPPQGQGTGGAVLVPPKTPVSAALEAVTWLRRTLGTSSQDIEPPASLREYFEECNVDQTPVIVKRAHDLSRVLFTVDDDNAATRRAQGIKLYNRVLESMLKAEETRLRHRRFSVLLGNESFHRALLACCFETVIFSYNIVTLAFPAVLRLFNLKAFDFSKVVESFVKHVPSQLPRVLKKHMGEVEDTILEKLAWQADSPLYGLLADPDLLGHVRQSLSSESLTQQPRPSAAQQMMSPIRGGTTLVQPTPVARPSKQTSGSANATELFFRKVLCLAAIRVKDLTSRLQLDDTVVKEVWACIKYAFSEKHTLMMNRHLDQIIMCCIYGVCKVNQLQATFRNIIDQYKKQPQATARVYRDVPIADPQHADIIMFYNSVFILEMKTFILRFQTPTWGGASTTNGLPPPASNSNGEGGRSRLLDVTSLAPLPMVPGSPQKVNGRENVYLSPRRLRMTPRTKSLYAFGESPARDLGEINRTLNRPHRIDFDDPQPVKKPKILQKFAEFTEKNLQPQPSSPHTPPQL